MNYPTEKLLPGACSYHEQSGLMLSIINDPQSGPEARAHAKCWATYRVLDDKISLHGWDAIMQPLRVGEIGDEQQRVRWETSQRVAEFYLNALKRDVWDVTWDEEAPVAEWLRMHPSFCVSYMRVNAVMAMKALREGRVEECRQRVYDAMYTGLRTGARLHPDQHVLRLLEMRDDWHAQVALILIGQEAGCIPKVHAPWASWEMMERDDGHLPYMSCLKRLGAGNNKHEPRN